MVPFTPDLLKPADTLLYRPVRLTWRNPLGWCFGRIIAIKTWHSISHVEVYAGDGQSYASRDGVGVGVYPLRTADLAYVLRPLIAYRCDLDLEAGRRWFTGVRGQGYDWRGLLRFANFHPTSKTRMFCSAFWLRFYRACGFDPFSRRIDADSIAPGEILDSPRLVVVWDDGRDPDVATFT